MSENLHSPTTLPPTEPNAETNFSEVVGPALHGETYDFGIGEVLRITPEFTRNNETTGEPASPILYVQGMNGNDKLPDMMAYLAQHDQRPVIAVRYHDKAAGSPKPVESGMRGYRPDATIPELDVHRTDDLLGALSILDDVEKVSIVAESAGGVRALLLAEVLSGSESHTLGVESVLLVDPAGQDGRSYRQTHFDALRLARAEKRNAKLGELMLETIAETPTISGIKKQRRDRPEQRAVAYAQVQQVLADVARRVPVRVLSDVSDVAFRTERIAEQMELSGANQHAELVQTDKNGHGVGLNKAALDIVITNLHELEQAGAKAI